MIQYADETMLCVDPSKPGNNTGWALFDCGRLLDCGLHTSVKIDPHNPPLKRAPDLLVIEIPQIYPGAHDEDPNDLIQVTRAVGMWEQWVVWLRCDVKILRVHPREWKGQVPKKIHNERVLDRLSPTERTLLPKLPASKLHNVIDAIGLGLWALDRMNVKSIPSGLACTRGKL